MFNRIIFGKPSAVPEPVQPPPAAVAEPQAPPARDTRPVLERLEDACEYGSLADMKTIIEEMRAAGNLNNFLKGIMLLGIRDAGVVTIDKLIDPNMEISGGPLLATVAGHLSYGASDTLGSLFQQRWMMMRLLRAGADPNSKFCVTVPMEQVQPMDVFSMAITPALLAPTKGGNQNFGPLLEEMCQHGLVLEGSDVLPSKLQQVVLALHPSKLLDKDLIERREQALQQYEKEGEENRCFTRRAFSMPNYMVQDVFEILTQHGADAHCRFTKKNSGGDPELAGKTINEALDGYIAQFTAIRDDPAKRAQWESAHLPEDSWEKRAFDTSPESIDAAIKTYQVAKRALATTPERAPSRSI